MIMAGTRESGPELERRMALTSAGPVKGCIGAAAMTRSGTVSAIASKASVGLVGLDTARADGGEHGPHQRKDRPAIVDDGDDERVEMAPKGAMVEHRTSSLEPPRRRACGDGANLVRGS
jgi:hypothetical protein